MKKAVLVFSILFGTLISIPSFVQAAEPLQCKAALSHLSLPNKNLPELRALIRRVFERAYDPEDSTKKRDKTGFLVETDPKDLNYLRHPFKAVKQYIPRKISESKLGTKHDLDIAGGINYHYGNFTEKRGARRQLTAFSLILGSLIASLPTLPYEIRGWRLAQNKSVDYWVDSKILYSWKDWGENIKYDFRDYQISLDLKSGEISEFQARQQAYHNELVYKDFRDFMRDRKKPKDYAHKRPSYEKSELFRHVEDLKLYMMGDRAGFFAISPGPMSDQQEAAVFKLDEDLAVNYEVIKTWVSMGAPVPESLPDSTGEFKTQIISVLNNDFARDLITLRDKNQITNLQLQFLLQRDISDQHDYNISTLLGLIPYEFENGEYTKKLDMTSLEGLRAETLKNLQSDLEASNLN
jgi:hypothetical protein